MADICLILMTIFYLHHYSGHSDRNYLWPEYKNAGFYLLLYILMLLPGGLIHQELSDFFLPYIQHVYAPTFAVITLMVSYALFQDQALNKIMDYIALAFIGISILLLVAIFGKMLGLDTSWAYTSANKLSFPFNASNQLAGYLVCSYPVALAVISLNYQSRLKYTLMVLISGVFLLTVLWTGSRSAFLLSIAEYLSLPFLFAWYTGNASQRKPRALLGLLVALSVVMAIVMSGTSNPAVQRAMSPLTEVAKGNEFVDPKARTEIYQDAYSLIDSHHLTGAGLGATKMLGENEPHNNYLGIYAEAGLLPFIMILPLFFLLPVLLFVYSVAYSRYLPTSLSVYLISLSASITAVTMYGFVHYELRQRWVWLALLLGVEAFRQIRKSHADINLKKSALAQ